MFVGLFVMFVALGDRVYAGSCTGRYESMYSWLLWLCIHGCYVAIVYVRRSPALCGISQSVCNVKSCGVDV